jgi:hypothetical protein
MSGREQISCRHIAVETDATTGRRTAQCTGPGLGLLAPAGDRERYPDRECDE